MAADPSQRATEVEIEVVTQALVGIEMKLPGAGGLRGKVTIAPGQAREFAQAAITALDAHRGNDLAMLIAGLERLVDGSWISDPNTGSVTKREYASFLLASLRAARASTPEPSE